MVAAFRGCEGAQLLAVFEGIPVQDAHQVYTIINIDQPI